jgi:hypothetical protein
MTNLQRPPGAESGSTIAKCWSWAVLLPKGASDYPYLGGLAAGGLSEKFFARSIMLHRIHTLISSFYST